MKKKLIPLLPFLTLIILGSIASAQTTAVPAAGVTGVVRHNLIPARITTMRAIAEFADNAVGSARMLRLWSPRDKYKEINSLAEVAAGALLKKGRCSTVISSTALTRCLSGCFPRPSRLQAAAIDHDSEPSAHCRRCKNCTDRLRSSPPSSWLQFSSLSCSRPSKTALRVAPPHGIRLSKDFDHYIFPTREIAAASSGDDRTSIGIELPAQD